jgi:hypothetical protein
MKTLVKAAVSAALGLVAFGLMLFLPAGTFHYWQAGSSSQYSRSIRGSPAFTWYAKIRPR